MRSIFLCIVDFVPFRGCFRRKRLTALYTKYILLGGIRRFWNQEERADRQQIDFPVEVWPLVAYTEKKTENGENQ